jgi:predicted metal-dependent phosphoesterase TrpH
MVVADAAVDRVASNTVHKDGVAVAAVVAKVESFHTEEAVVNMRQLKEGNDTWQTEEAGHMDNCVAWESAAVVAAAVDDDSKDTDTTETVIVVS